MRHYALLWTGSFVAVVFWLFDSTAHRYVYGEERFELIPSDFNELWMRVVICLLFVLFGGYAAVSRRREHRLEVEKSVEHRIAGALTLALGEFLPICAHCKKVRTEDNEWVRLEKYIGTRTNTTLSHGICPPCAHELYPDFGQVGDGEPDLPV